MKTAKKLISIILLIVLCLGIPILGASLAESGEQQAVIGSFFSSINSGDWESWANLFIGPYRAERLAFVNNEQNKLNNVGILTVRTALLTECERIKTYMPQGYRELLEFYDSGDYVCYRVRVDFTVAEANEFFENGEAYKVICLAYEGGSWRVGAMVSCPDWLLSNGKSSGKVYELKDESSSVISVELTESVSVSFDMSIKGGFRVLSESEGEANGQSVAEYRIYDRRGIAAGTLTYAYPNAVYNGETAYGTYEQLFSESSYRNLVMSEFPLEQFPDMDLSRGFTEIYTGRNTDNCAAVLTYSKASGYNAEEHVYIIAYEPTNGIFVVLVLNNARFGAIDIIDIAESLHIEVK